MPDVTRMDMQAEGLTVAWTVYWQYRLLWVCARA